MAVHMLSLVDILRVKGPDGVELPVEVEFVGETVT
jgi:hypothetical protein